MSKTTWRQGIKEVTDEPILSSVGDLDKPFNDGFGGSEGPDFVAWTEHLVLFPVVYDGSEWVGTAPRNPGEDPQPLEHQGGE